VTRILVVTIFVAELAAPGFLRAESTASIPPGTVITLANWQQYRQFMSDGFQNMLAGEYAWKFPPDFQLVVGPTSHYPLPQSYLDATAKYSKLVRIIDLPDGGHSIAGYVAGCPFPNPQNPMKGYKILVNNWYRWMPYLVCGDDGHQYLEDSFGSVTMSKYAMVDRRLSHISAKGQPINNPRAQGVDLTEWEMVLEPEQLKYTETLTLYYTDPKKPEDDFVFVPTLRRVIRESPSSRCAPAYGSDFIFDDFRGGFNGGITRFQADYLRDQAVLTLVDARPENYGNRANYYDIFFPKPIVGRWEVRPSYVIDVRRIPSMQAGYCYGKQIMWVDQYSYQILWKDIYNAKMQFQKVAMTNHIAAPVPDEGIQYETENELQTFWSVDHKHLSAWVTSGGSSRGNVANSDCRNLNGVNYDDIARYSTVSGLNQSMR
jgi:hypothetical protein